MRFRGIAQARVRVASIDDYDFNDERNDDHVYTSQRLRLGFEADMWKRLLLHVEAQDTELQHGVFPLNTDQDGPDLRRAYATVRDLGPLSLTLGRQDFTLGSERLFGVFDVRNLDYHYDGARLDGAWDRLHATAFGFRPVKVEIGNINPPDEDILFAGAHVKYDLSKAVTGEVLYVFNDDDRERYVGRLGRPPGDLWLHLVDLRLSGTIVKDLAFDIEGAEEFGDYGPNTLSSFAVWTKLTYTFSELRWAPYVGTQFNYASGDQRPTDGTTGTFVGLRPYVPNYVYYNWSNLREVVGTFGFWPKAGMIVQFDYRLVDLAERRDAFYGEPYGVYLWDPTGAGGTHMGQELDIWGRWNFTDHIWVEGAFSQFFAGEFPRHIAGDGAGPQYIYFQVVVNY